MIQESVVAAQATPSGLARSAWTHATALPFVVLGAMGVVGGGLLSAALAPIASYHSSWAVAYIVLIAGVAQIVLGVSQTALTGGTVRARTVAAQAVCWNLGTAATVFGTLADVVPVLYVGAVLQVSTLVLVLYTTRHARAGWVAVTLRLVSVLLLISVPTGIVLQALTH